MKAQETTIAALASAPQPAGIAVIRVSGPQTKLALHTLFKGKLDPVKYPRRVIYGNMIDHETGEIIDKGLAFFMPGPLSYTGEDVGEFQFHGSPLLVKKVLRSLYAFGISPAEPGEFTRRAFIHGKMDLIQAEAISDLISASSERALKIAGEQLSGRLSSALNEVGEPLRNALAELEAIIDFSEEDIEPQSMLQITSSVSTAHQKVQELLGTYQYGSVVRDGFRVLLCGHPNVGKSSIMNVLLERPRAIVSAKSGTTRDVLEEEVILGGYRFIICDVAGLRSTEDEIEQIGVERARERIGWADLILLIADASEPQEVWQKIRDELRGSGQKVWMVTNKIDLNPSAIGSYYCDSTVCEQNLYLSAKTRQGLDGLIEALVSEVANRQSEVSDSSIVVTNERQRNGLLKSEQFLQAALLGPERKHPPEIIAEDIRQALKALDEIVGKTTSEDILGRIFSKFCIGK